MISLALAAASFSGIHLLVSGTQARDALVARLGAGPYRGLFSVASAGSLAWLIVAYSRVRVPEATPFMQWRWLASVSVFLAFALVTLGLLTRSPTAVGGEKLLASGRGARGIHRVTRHPFLWGVAIWSATHIVFNPGLPHLLFFGTFLVVALAGTVSIDQKRVRAYGESWRRYAAETSNVPFLALVQRRNRIAWSEFGVLKLLLAAGAFALAAALHARVLGVAPF
jgi:uncharacterized membrane protein